MNASSIASLPSERVPGVGASVRRLRSRPAPCRRSRARRSSAPPGSRRAPRPLRDRRRLATARERRDRQTAAARNVFSRMRCCAIASARPLGLTTRAASAAAAAAAGTFSNSKVTTSTPLRELADRVEIVVRGVDLDVGNLAGRRVVLGRERVDAVAEPAGGHREHAAQAGRRRARRWWNRER